MADSCFIKQPAHAKCTKKLLTMPTKMLNHMPDCVQKSKELVSFCEIGLLGKVKFCWQSSVPWQEGALVLILYFAVEGAHAPCAPILGLPLVLVLSIY